MFIALGESRATNSESAQDCPELRASGPSGLKRRGSMQTGSVIAPDLTGSCSTSGALTQAWVQDPPGSLRIVQDPARPD
eukprot:4433079-Pyramimonas_sp.AAC.1